MGIGGLHDADRDPDIDEAHEVRGGHRDRGDRGQPEAPGERPDREDQLKAHAESRVKADDTYRVYAIEQGCERVRETEKHVVTPAMRRIEAEDPERTLVGLNRRLKGRERVMEKVTEAVDERGHTVQEAFGLIKDAVRYTFCYPDDRYTEGVLADCQRLEDAGFERVDRRNSWREEEYKGINSRWWVSGNGQVFEVQFHTQASYQAKQQTHWAYERLRVLPDDEAEVRQLRAYQREVTAKVPIPPGAADIPDYRYR